MEAGLPASEHCSLLTQPSHTLLTRLSIQHADVYSTLEPSDRVGDGKGAIVEREALQVKPRNLLADAVERCSSCYTRCCFVRVFQAISERKHFIRAGRPAVGLMDNKPPPLDSWV